jgi:hypothetical protein
MLASNSGEVLGAMGSNNNWDMYQRFSIDSTANVRARVGVSDRQETDAVPSAGYFIRYDTNACCSDTNWQLCTSTGASESCQDTGTAANTSYHTVRIRSTTAGTILLTLDGGTEYSFCAAACDVTATISTENMGAMFLIFNDTTADKKMNVDVFAFEATGLSR